MGGAVKERGDGWGELEGGFKAYEGSQLASLGSQLIEGVSRSGGIGQSDAIIPHHSISHGGCSFTVWEVLPMLVGSPHWGG